MFGRGPPSVRLCFGCCGCRAECVLLAGAARLTVSDRQLAAGLDAGVTAVLVAAFQRRWRVFAGRGRAAWWCRWRPRLASQRPTDTTSRPPRHRTFPAGIPPEWETSPPSAPPAAATVAAGAPQAHVSTVQVPQLPRDYVPKGGEWPEGGPSWATPPKKHSSRRASPRASANAAPSKRPMPTRSPGAPESAPKPSTTSATEKPGPTSSPSPDQRSTSTAAYGATNTSPAAQSPQARADGSSLRHRTDQRQTVAHRS